MIAYINEREREREGEYFYCFLISCLSTLLLFSFMTKKFKLNCQTVHTRFCMQETACTSKMLWRLSSVIVVSVTAASVSLMRNENYCLKDIISEKERERESDNFIDDGNG